jgi:hypothetical protein
LLGAADAVQEDVVATRRAGGAAPPQRRDRSAGLTVTTPIAISRSPAYQTDRYVGHHAQAGAPPGGRRRAAIVGARALPEERAFRLSSFVSQLMSRSP